MNWGVFVYIFFCVVSLGGVALHDEDIADGDITIPVLWVSFFLVLYFVNVCYWSFKGRPVLTPESFFVGFYSLFHFSYVVLYVYGLSDYDSEVFYNYSALEKAIYYCLACVCVFIVFYRLSCFSNSQATDGRVLQNIYKRGASDKNIELTYRLSKLLLLSALLFFWIPVIPVYKVVFSDYRSLISIGEISPLGRLFWLGQYIGYAAISLYLTIKSQSGRKLNSGWSVIVLYAYMASFLLTGDRGGFISYLFMFLFAYVLYEKNIRIRNVFLVSVVLLFISSVVAVTRSQSLINPIDMIVYYIEGGTGGSLVEALNEFGISIKTVVVALTVAPKYYDFWYGASFIDSFLLVLPNPFFDARVSEGLGVFITEVAFGPIDSTHGRGGSIAMEAYLNFWYFGVILFALYGVFLRRVFVGLLIKTSIVRSVLFLSSIGAFSMWMRNTSGASFRIIIWSVLISSFIVFLSRRMRSRS